MVSDGDNAISVRSVRRKLQRAGLRGCMAIKWPFISAVNKGKRLKFV